MKKTNHIPVRTCVGCGQPAKRSQLLRLVLRNEMLVPDTRGTMSGRGAYLHAEPNCVRLFSSRKGTIRSLRQPVARRERAALVQKLNDEGFADGAQGT